MYKCLAARTEDVFAACAGTGFSGLFGFFVRRDYFGVRNRGARCVLNCPNKTRGLSLRNNCAEKMSKATAAAVSLPFKLCPPIVADTFLVGAPPPQRDRSKCTRHLPAKRKNRSRHIYSRNGRASGVREHVLS